MTQTVFLITFVGYILLLILMSLYMKNGAIQDISQFSKGGSRFGSIVITVVSMGAWVGSAGLVGLANWSYEWGVGQWWSYALIYICFFPWIFLYIKRIKILNLKSIPEFYATRYPKYGGVIKYPTSFLLLIRNATVLCMQLNAMALLFTTFLGWSHVFGVVISAIIVMVYVSISGMLSVMVTNTFQSLLQILAPFTAVVFVLIAAGGWDSVVSYYELNDSLANLNLFKGVNWYGDVFYYFLTTGAFFIFICDQADWQRVVAAKDWRVARKGTLTGLILILPILVIPCIVGAIARTILPEGTDYNYAFFEVIKLAPAPLGVFLTCCVMATILSCVSSYLFAGGVNISNDIIIDILEKKRKAPLSDKEQIFYTRLGVILCTLV